MSDNPTNNANGRDHSPATNQPPDRAAINRANAQKSTGPRTEAGKQRSSLNALRHGLTGHTMVMPTQDLAAYQLHVQEFLTEYHPKSATEKQLVQTIADTTWRLNRVMALETNLLTLGMTEHADSVNTADPEVHAALATAESLREQTKALANLSMYEQRLSRQFEKALKQLREIQAERIEREQHQLRNASKLLEMHKEKGRPYNPAEDGFVFSNGEIETYIHRNNRQEQANDAHYYRASAT